MQSMTGYGQAGKSADGRSVTVEVRCVNHRFLDLHLRLPRVLNAEEAFIRETAKEQLVRGHADISVTYLNTREDAVTVTADTGRARAYWRAIGEVRSALGFDQAQDDLRMLLSQPGILNEQPAEENMDALEALLKEALEEAFGQVRSARLREGERLKADMSGHLSALAALTEQLTALAADLPAQYQARLTERLARLQSPAEPQRLAQEVALFADRCAIDEELSRLKAHIAEMRSILGAEGTIGKQLDFLLQEMNREANTAASKSVSLEVTRAAVQCKNEIEKLREQAQNVL